MEAVETDLSRDARRDSLARCLDEAMTTDGASPCEHHGPHDRRLSRETLRTWALCHWWT